MTAVDIIKEKELQEFNTRVEAIRALAESQAWLGLKSKTWRLPDFRYFSPTASDHVASILKKEGLMVRIKGSSCKITIVSNNCK